MRLNDHGRYRPIAAAFALTALLAGCVTYSQSELAALSAADICELRYMQGPNLSPQARDNIQGELKRRNDNCGNHAAEVEERFAQFMYRETYGKGDSPP